MTLDEYPIDDEYIDTEKRRAAIRKSREKEEPTVDRSPESADRSHVFGNNEEFGDEIDQSSPNATLPVGPEQASESQTVFNPYENNKNAEKWKRLRRWQGDYRAKSRGRQNAEADQRSYVVTFGSQLGITSYQKERCLRIVSDLNLNKFGRYSAEIVVLAIISLVTNADARWIRDEETFKDLLREVGGSLKDVRNARNIIRGYIDV